MEKMEAPDSYSIHLSRYRKVKRENTFWTFTLIALLFMMLSLILLINLSNFVMTSQTRNMLLEIALTKNQDAFISPESTTIKTGSPETTQATTETTTKLSSQISTVTSTQNDASTLSENLSTNSESSSTEAIEKRNPIIILNENHHFKPNFTCFQSCNDPSIYTAQLKLPLSANREHFLSLKAQVLTNDSRVAKRRAAYLALYYLYKEHLHEAQTDLEWNLSTENCRNESLTEIRY